MGVVYLSVGAWGRSSCGCKAHFSWDFLSGSTVLSGPL